MFHLIWSFSHIWALISCLDFLRCKTVQISKCTERTLCMTNIVLKEYSPERCHFWNSPLIKRPAELLKYICPCFDHWHTIIQLYSVYFIQYRIVSFYLLAVRQLHLFKSNCSVSFAICNCPFYSLKKYYVFIKETSSSVPLLFLLHFSNLYIN